MWGNLSVKAELGCPRGRRSRVKRQGHLGRMEYKIYGFGRKEGGRGQHCSKTKGQMGIRRNSTIKNTEEQVR